MSTGYHALSPSSSTSYCVTLQLGSAFGVRKYFRRDDGIACLCCSVIVDGMSICCAVTLQQSLYKLYEPLSDGIWQEGLVQWLWVRF